MREEVQKFGKRLKELRLKMKMSQGDVAKKMSVDRSYISGLERGKRNPSLLSLKKLAKAIGVDINELVK